MAEIKRILSVEDDELQQETIVDILRLVFGAGVEVTTAGDLQSALEEAAKKPFDLYISDGAYPEGPAGEPWAGMGIRFYGKLTQMYEQGIRFVIVSHGDYEEMANKLGIGFVQKGKVPEGIGALAAKYAQEN